MHKASGRMLAKQNGINFDELMLSRFLKGMGLPYDIKIVQSLNKSQQLVTEGSTDGP